MRMVKFASSALSVPSPNKPKRISIITERGSTKSVKILLIIFFAILESLVTVDGVTTTTLVLGAGLLNFKFFFKINAFLGIF